MSSDQKTNPPRDLAGSTLHISWKTCCFWGLLFLFGAPLGFLASSLLLKVDGRAVGCGPRSVARESHGDALGAGLPISLEAGFPAGPGCGKGQQGWANSSRQYLKMVISSLTVWAIHCVHSARLAWITHPFTRPRKSRAMAGNGERPRQGRERRPSRTRRTTQWLRGEEALRNLELAFGTSLHSSRWRW